MLENLGFAVMGEHRSVVTPADSDPVLVQEFDLRHSLGPSLGAWREAETDCLAELWQGQLVDDSFNRLVISARCSWREANMLRASARYMHQLPGALSDEFVAETLASHADIARRLVDPFEQRFSPERADCEGEESTLSEAIGLLIDEVPLLNEDRVLRQYLELMTATQWTSFCRDYAESLAFKIHPRGIADRDRATLALRRQARRACTWLLRGGFLSERIESTIQRLRPALSGGGFDALPTVLAAVELGTDPADALDRAVDLAATLRIADIGDALECALINSPWARLEARQLADDVTRMIATAAANPEVAERLAGPDLAAWLATVQELATDALPAGDGHEAVEQGTDLVRLRVIVRRLQDLAH